MAPLHFVGTFLQMQLASQIKPPLFDEESDSWSDFFWECDEYWQILTDGGGVVSEWEKLKVFGQCLGKHLKDPITYLKKVLAQLHFSMFLLILSKSMGKERVWVYERPGRPLKCPPKES